MRKSNAVDCYCHSSKLAIHTVRRKVVVIFSFIYIFSHFVQSSIRFDEITLFRRINLDSTRTV